jgi:hypothetical protein
MENPDDYVGEHLRDELIHDPRVQEQDLTVRVDGNRVTVGGCVSTNERQAAVAQVAQELMPGKIITNETVVVAADEPDADGDERLS